MNASTATAEAVRLQEARSEVPWKRWGPYLAERAWGTVREDYSDDGNAWGSFGHDQAHLRAYRWTEDGLLGICDEEQRLCLGLCVWNERDAILKERLFGLGNPEGNHGEDVKELYFFEDALPTAALLRATYLYPQRAYPYDELVDANASRTAHDPEYELLDTGIFDEERFFEIEVVYTKAAPDAIVMRVRATNRGPDPAALHLMPTIWFRNTWAWTDPPGVQPELSLVEGVVRAEHPTLGRYHLAARCEGTPVAWLFTDNETNTQASRHHEPTVLRQGRLSPLFDWGRGRRDQPGPTRHEGGSARPLGRWPRSDGRDDLRFGRERDGRAGGAPRRGGRAHRAAKRRSRCVLRGPRPSDHDPGRATRPAASAGGCVVVACLHRARRRALARGRPRAPARGPRLGAERGLGPRARTRRAGRP